MAEVFSGLNPPYNVIYADPPWHYNDKRRGQGGAEDHYSTMSIDELRALPVSELAADNSILFMWVTFPNLIPGMNLFPAWGFRYKTLGFSWIKTYPHKRKLFFGIGHYTKSNCELCLIGVKGSPAIVDNSISSVIVSSIERHSKKPDIARTKIEKLCGDVKRVELFARQRYDGWDCWGNEVD